jgi:serine/threonine-protein kinase RsbW
MGMEKMGKKRIRLIIESDFEQIPLVGMAVSRYAEILLPGRIDPLHMEICAVEAVTNSVKHACGIGSEKEVEVIFTLSDDFVTIDVCDEGTALNRTILESKGAESFAYDPDDLESLSEGGRGLAIIKEIMDEVSYETRDGRNCLRMVKRLAEKALENHNPL